MNSSYEDLQVRQRAFQEQLAVYRSYKKLTPEQRQEYEEPRAWARSRILQEQLAIDPSYESLTPEQQHQYDASKSKMSSEEDEQMNTHNVNTQHTTSTTPTSTHNVNAFENNGRSSDN